MNILSLYDGISGAMIALRRAGIVVDNYYASEIDKYAEAVSKYHFPEIKRLGDVTKIQGKELPKIDLIIGGFPCQSYSLAGKRLNFDDPRGKLLFEAVRLIKECQPKYFILENVKMKKEIRDAISTLIGVGHIEINSSLLSAQQRKRNYWCNFFVEQPEDKGILLRDIILSDASEPILHNIYGGFKESKPRTFGDKSPTIRTSAGGGHIPSLILTNKALQYMDRKVRDGRTHWDFKHHSDVKEDKSNCVVANFYKGIPYNVLITEKCIRYFDPIEIERLQTLPDNYTQYGIFDNQVKKISNTQRYKMIGNGFTVDVISHIIKNSQLPFP